MIATRIKCITTIPCEMSRSFSHKQRPSAIVVLQSTYYTCTAITSDTAQTP